MLEEELRRKLCINKFHSFKDVVTVIVREIICNEFCHGQLAAEYKTPEGLVSYSQLPTFVTIYGFGKSVKLRSHPMRRGVLYCVVVPARHLQTYANVC